MNHVLSQNGQSTSQAFVCFWWVHLPANSFFPQARLTGIIGLAPPPTLFDFYSACARFSLVPALICADSWGRGFYFPFNFHVSFSHAQSKNLPPPAAMMANGGDSPVL